MSKLMSFATILLLLFGTIGCSDDNDLEVILGADKTELAFSATDEPQTVNVSCNTDWTAKSDKNWCKVSPSGGNGEGTLTIESEPNQGTEVRQAVVILVARNKTFEIKVKQGTGGVYEIKIPDFSESFVYNIKDGDTRIAELCREAVPGGAEAVITLYVLEEGGKYPVSGYVVNNGGAIKYDGSGYTPGTATNETESVFLVKGEVKTSAEMAVAATVEPELLKDVDENTYKITKIGGEYWMAENLKVSAYRDEMPVDYVTDTETLETYTKGAYCWYDNEEANKDIYGALYNGYAITNGRNLAPKGWHIPTADEWNDMQTYLGATLETGYVYDVAAKLRAISDLWTETDPQNPSTNVSGLSILPGGYLKSDWRQGDKLVFDLKGTGGCFWAKPRVGDFETDLWRQMIDAYPTIGDAYVWPITEAYSVRCKKDVQE